MDIKMYLTDPPNAGNVTYKDPNCCTLIHHQVCFEATLSRSCSQLRTEHSRDTKADKVIPWGLAMAQGLPAKPSLGCRTV